MDDRKKQMLNRFQEVRSLSKKKHADVETALFVELEAFMLNFKDAYLLD